MTVRVDRRLSDGGNLFGRFIAYGVNDAQPFGSSQLNETLVPGFGRVVTTRTRSLAVGHTHTFGTSALNEVRFGFLDVSGGQESQNQGVDFAAATGLQGVTRDPRDVGYPQVAFGGAYSVIGDPTTFVSRRNRSAELYENLLLDRGDHRFKFGAYVFRLAFNPVNPQAARGAFTYTGQWSGNAFADFLLGYPTSAQVGIGRADEHGRTNWWHFYGQDDWRVRSNVTVNYGLRYEINGQMNDVDNRLSAIDVTVPGGRFVIASDDRGQMSSAAQPLLAQIPTPYVTSKDAGWTPALLEPSYRRIAPRVGMAWSIPGRRDTVVTAGFGVFLNQWAYSVQQALAQTLPFFFAKIDQRGCRCDNAAVPDRNGAAGRRQRQRRRQHDESRLPDGVRQKLDGERPAPACLEYDPRGGVPAVRCIRCGQLHRVERARAGAGTDRRASSRYPR